MYTLFALKEIVTRVMVAFAILMFIYKFLPLIVKELKIDFLVIVAILYLLFLMSLKIWPVW